MGGLGTNWLVATVIRAALTAAALAALVASHWWVWRTAEEHGRQEVQIEVMAAREALQVAYQLQAQQSRQAAAEIRAAERARDLATQEALDALDPDDRRIDLAPGAVDLLRSIR